MTTSMNTLAATEHIADLHRAADRRRLTAARRLSIGAALPPAPAVALRLADAGDIPLIQRLAALDDAPAVDGLVLLALMDDEAVAALSLLDGRVIANPFVATSEAVALLRLRAEHLSGARPRRRLRAVLRPRLA
ncbi:MAG: hypothetical protein ACRDNK_05725 [Solirubrobacteraceae bacterium]